jgi:hypothetical protein
VAATKAELWTQFLNLVKQIDELWKYTASNATNWLGVEETIQESYVGNHVGSTQQVLTSMRASLSSVIAQGRSLCQPVLLELSKIGYDSVATSISRALDDIYDGMETAGETVRYRNFTYGSLTTGGSNNGTGIPYRIINDKNDYSIEAGAAGLTKMKITKDFAAGRTKGNEEYVLYGEGEWPTDEIARGDTPGETKTLAVKRATDGLLTNGDFETITGSGASLAASGWTFDDPTNFAEETTDQYRGSKCLDMVANGSLTQYLNTVTIDPTKPVFVRVMFNREASCDGTLTLRLGTKTEAVALAAQSGWTAITIMDTNAENVWYSQFKEDFTGSLGIRVSLTLTLRTTGNLLVDEFTVIQPDLFNGTWYVLCAGGTEFLRDDFFSWTDTIAETGRTQHWTARMYGKYFPHASAAETYADA